MQFLKIILQKDFIKYVLIALIVLLFFTQLKKILALFGFGKSDKDKLSELLETAQTNDNPALNLWSDTTALNVSDKLFNAMGGVGTDEDILEYVLKELEQTPVYNTALVFQKFGLKKYFMGSKSFFFGTDLNLSEWINEELGNSDKDLLNRWNTQLRSAGVV